MSFKDYTPVLDLNKSKIKWTIRVRAQAIWQGISRDTNEVRGINILFFDDCYTRIHAFVNAKISGRFEKELEEGEIYKVTNFVVKEYLGDEMNRCIRNEKHIYFADFTTLTRDSQNGLPFSRHSFDIFNLVETEKIGSANRFLCDIIGIIDGNHTKREYVNEKSEKKTQVKFSITDGSCTRKVTFFDKFAQMVDGLLNEKKDEAAIVIIACAKINKYEGEIYLTNYPATRFYMNLDHDMVNQLKIKSLNPCFFENQVHFDDAPTIPIMSIDEIKNLSIDYTEKEVDCQVNLKKVEEETKWYCYICPKCNIELNKQDEKYICPNEKCKRHYPYPARSFRICTLCSDSTGVIAIVFHDAEMKKLTGKTVFEMQLEEVAHPQLSGQLPHAIKSLEGKDYTVTLKLKIDNFSNATAVYEASSVSEGFYQLVDKKIATQSATQSEENMNPHDMGDCFAESQALENPTTSNSSAKSRARKSVAYNICIDDENVPIAKLKKK